MVLLPLWTRRLLERFIGGVPSVSGIRRDLRLTSGVLLLSILWFRLASDVFEAKEAL